MNDIEFGDSFSECSMHNGFKRGDGDLAGHSSWAFGSSAAGVCSGRS